MVSEMASGSAVRRRGSAVGLKSFPFGGRGDEILRRREKSSGSASGWCCGSLRGDGDFSWALDEDGTGRSRGRVALQIVSFIQLMKRKAGARSILALKSNHPLGKICWLGVRGAMRLIAGPFLAFS